MKKIKNDEIVFIAPRSYRFTGILTLLVGIGLMIFATWILPSHSQGNEMLVPALLLSSVGGMLASAVAPILILAGR